MKHLYLILSVILFPVTTEAQNNASVEKSINGVQTGFLGVWIHNETRLSNSIALRSEIGLDTGLFGGDYYKNVNFILFPTLNLEPRFYYNLNKRFNNDQSILKNSGNFLSVKLNYTPNAFVISSIESVSIAENFSLIPKWGIKRTVGNHFTYELGIGIGFRKYFLKQYGFTSNKTETALDLHLRVGYTF